MPPSPPAIMLPYDATNSAVIAVDGSAEPESMIYLTNNEQPSGNTITLEDGTFTFLNINLVPGSNVFAAVAVDKAGNKSKASVGENIIYSNTEPKLEIIKPTDEQTFSGNESPIEISGSTNSDNRVQINNRLVIVGVDGRFTTRAKLTSGINVISIIAIDVSGNQTKKEITVNYNP